MPWDESSLVGACTRKGETASLGFSAILNVSFAGNRAARFGLP
jgi:hypothetical protein